LPCARISTTNFASGDTAAARCGSRTTHGTRAVPNGNFDEESIVAALMQEKLE